MTTQPIPIITPIIHLNGDRRETLVTNLEDAYRAVNAAIKALTWCAPNGRNYYPELGRMQKSEVQHQARMAHLKAVRDSLEAEVIQMDEEKDHG